jgi:hypothetical protein
MIVRIRRHNHVGTALCALSEPGDGGSRIVSHLITGVRSPGGMPAWHNASPDAQRVAGWLNEPLALLPPDRPARTAWQCIVFADPEDQTLTDPQWAQVAAEIMHATGLARYGDGRGVRWVAARHGADHIHILATLARQDGTVPSSGRDLPAARKACQAAEDYLGLRSTQRMGKASLRQRLTAACCPAAPVPSREAPRLR